MLLFMKRAMDAGGFGTAQRIEVEGRVTAMAAGEINRADV
jgi:hypothetical protein